MRRMLLLRGPAFAGKTTLARALVRALDAELVSADAINDDRGVEYGGDGLASFESPADDEATRVFRPTDDRCSWIREHFGV